MATAIRTEDRPMRDALNVGTPQFRTGGHLGVRWEPSERPAEVRLVLAGDLDAATSNRLRDALVGLIRRGARYVLIDARDVRYADSFALSPLLWAGSRLEAVGGWIRLEGLPSSLAQTLGELGIPVWVEPPLPVS